MSSLAIVRMIYPSASLESAWVDSGNGHGHPAYLLYSTSDRRKSPVRLARAETEQEAWDRAVESLKGHPDARKMLAKVGAIEEN